MNGNPSSEDVVARRFPYYGWLGLALIAVFWPLNWTLSGLRTHLCFFPLWVGYCLTVDAINFYRRGTSLLTRSRAMYAGLFLISIPLWWTFEAINQRTQNWIYLGREHFSYLQYAFFSSLSYSTVVPAVLGSAELFAGFRFVRGLRRGPILPADRRTTLLFFVAGLVMFHLMLAWPLYFFPFVWLSLFFLLEPINVWLGHRSLLEWTARADWRPVLALCLGVLMCGFFWEMWNIHSYPKWRYNVPWFGFWRVFEMPLLGYFGYLPFSLEVYAMVHLFLGLAGRKQTSYVVDGLVVNGE